MKGFQKILALIGRLFLSTIFILSAVHKIFEWQKTETGLINLFCDWQSYVSFSSTLSKVFSGLISWVPEILITVTILELVGAVMVFFGIKERIGAFLLLIFFIPATLLLHPFWFLQGNMQTAQMIMFLKNFAIIGGLMLILAFGTKVHNHVFLTPPPMPSMPEENE